MIPAKTIRKKVGLETPFFNRVAKRALGKTPKEYTLLEYVKVSEFLGHYDRGYTQLDVDMARWLELRSRVKEYNKALTLVTAFLTLNTQREAQRWATINQLKREANTPLISVDLYSTEELENLSKEYEKFFRNFLDQDYKKVKIDLHQP